MSKRLLILGAGGWGQNWVRAANARPEWEVAGYVDANPAVLDRLETQRGVPRERLFADWRPALETVEADAATLTIPNPHRLPALEACLKRDLHLLVDKPLVHTPAEARQVRAWAEGHAGVFMIAQNYRLFPEAVAIKSLLDGQTVGPLGDVRLHFVRCIRSSHRPDHYVAHLEGWRPLGMEMTIHHWDLMRHFAAAEPVSVTAHAGRHDRSWGVGDTLIDAHVSFPRGVTVAYDAGWDYVRDVTGWPGHWQIRAEHGAAEWGPDGSAFQAFDADGKPLPVSVTPQDSTAAVFDRFTAAVDRRDAPYFCPLADNLKSLGLCWAAQRSAETGQTVDVAAFLAQEGLA